MWAVARSARSSTATRSVWPTDDWHSRASALCAVARWCAFFARVRSPGAACTHAGTTSLRALLVFDEGFGFLPPVAEPAGKRPLLTSRRFVRRPGRDSPRSLPVGPRPPGLSRSTFSRRARATWP
ncbi:MAG TPA: hypothetical protein DEP84_31150 [Chloroflexi bacterium]|nr:hypothetical protein [Chloroflexota bacterium]